MEKFKKLKPLELAEIACSTMMKKFEAQNLPPVGHFHYHQGVFLSGFEQTYLNTGKLGIVKDTGAAEEAVLKVQFIEYLMNMMQIPMVPAEEQLFFDVPLTNAYADVVNTAYTAGLTNGNTDGTFGIGAPINLNEAVIMAVRALGATILLPEGDNSYGSYINLAKKMNVLDDIKSTEDGNLDRGNVLRLLFNTLNADGIATNNGKDFYIDDTSLLENYYSIYTGEGVVESCQYGDIYGGKTQDKNRVVIDGTKYILDSVTAKELLGHRVTFYYTEGNNGSTDEIVFLYSDGTNITEIDVEDVEYHKQGRLEYLDTDDKTDSVKISETALTLVNGKRTSVGSSGMVLPKHGVVTLIDNDSDGKYDIVSYDSYVISMVSNINAAEEKLYTHNSDYKAIDLSEYEDYYIYDTEGNSLALSSLAKDTLINIRENGYKTVIEIVVCTGVADFDIASMTTETEDGVIIYYFEDAQGNVYSTVSDFADIYEKNDVITSAVKKNNETNTETIDMSFIMSNKYVFALNSDGKIAAVLERKESDGYMYGYIIDTDKNESGLTDYVKVRMLTVEDGVVDYSLAERVRIMNGSDSDTIDRGDITLNPGVVRYRMNSDGIISFMEFPGDVDTETGFRKDKTTSTGGNDNTRYYSGTKLIGGKIAVNADTTVFFIPSADHEGEVEWYSAGKGSSIVNGHYYPSSVTYKYDNDIYADVIVTGSSAENKSGMMLVEKIVKMYDKKTGEAYEAIKGYVNGTLMAYGIDATIPYPAHSKAPNFRAAPGDVIRFGIAPTGYISNIEPVLDLSAGKVYNYNMSSTVRYVFGNNECQLYGQMNEIYEGVFMNMICEDENFADYYYRISSGTRIYQFDAEDRKNTIKTITASDIPTLKSGTCTDEHTLIVTNDSTTELVVVYK